MQNLKRKAPTVGESCMDPLHVQKYQQAIARIEDGMAPGTEAAVLNISQLFKEII